MNKNGYTYCRSHCNLQTTVYATIKNIISTLFKNAVQVVITNIENITNIETIFTLQKSSEGRTSTELRVLSPTFSAIFDVAKVLISIT